jgi:hypothetical protein
MSQDNEADIFIAQKELDQALADGEEDFSAPVRQVALDDSGRLPQGFSWAE